MPSCALVTPAQCLPAPIILRRGGVYNLVGPPHFWLEREDAPVSRRCSRLTRLADILLFSWLGDRHCCVDLVGASEARRLATEVLGLIQKAKLAKHAQTCLAHGFDFAHLVSFSQGRSALQHKGSSLESISDMSPMCISSHGIKGQKCKLYNRYI